MVEVATTATQVIHSDSTLLQRNRTVIRIDLPASLLFCLKRVDKSRHLGITEIILEIFLEDVFEEVKAEMMGQQQKKWYGNGNGHGHRIGRTPIQGVDKYFFHFYPYPIKHLSEDKIKTRTRSFNLVTSRSFSDSIKDLAFIHMMTVNEFLIQILSERMVEKLQDPMLFLKHIPDY